MPRVRTTHRCTECGAASPKWAGRCGTCGGWNTLVEEVEVTGPSGRSADGLVPADRPVPILEVDVSGSEAQATGVAELDRVLGGGLVPGSVTLLGGEPGIGKSTLLLQALARRAAAAEPVLYVSAEESKQQVRSRAERLGALPASLWLMAESVLPAIVAALDEVGPTVVVIDSIQTVVDPELGSAPGSVAQVRECAYRLVQEAKRRAIAVLLVGHVTKDGGLAGPRVLEHVVDTVLAFEGDRHHALRLLRAVKHRFGATNELGLFEMTEAGLVGVPDPSGLFLADRRLGVPGSAVVPVLEGQRPLLVEVQALVATSTLALPRRSAQGLDHGRLRAAHRGARAAGRPGRRRHGRVRLGGRRRAPRRARRRSRRLPGHGVLARRRARAGEPRGLRRGGPRPASSARSRRRLAGWARRRGSASPGPSCRRRPRTVWRG